MNFPIFKKERKKIFPSFRKSSLDLSLSASSLNHLGGQNKQSKFLVVVVVVTDTQQFLNVVFPIKSVNNEKVSLIFGSYKLSSTN